MKGKIKKLMVGLVTIAVLFPALAFSQEIPRKMEGASWVNFKEGSWVKYKMWGETMEKHTLKSKTADEVVIIEETESPGMPSSSQEGHISLKPEEEEDQIKVLKTSEEEISLAGKKFKCQVIEYEAVEDGEKYTYKVWISDDVPYYIFDRGVVKATQQGEGEKEAKVIWEYAGEKEFTAGDKTVKCAIFKGFSGEYFETEEGVEMEIWLSKQVPGMLVKMGSGEAALIELVDFEVK